MTTFAKRRTTRARKTRRTKASARKTGRNTLRFTGTKSNARRIMTSGRMRRAA
jgi:hypothetical protein